MIPCFDQPDLKASLALNVILPTNWIAIGNEMVGHTGVYSETEYIQYAPHQDESLLVGKYLVGKKGNFYVFNSTEQISTYLYCLAAG